MHWHAGAEAPCRCDVNTGNLIFDCGSIISAGAVAALMPAKQHDSGFLFNFIIFTHSAGYRGLSVALLVIAVSAAATF